MDQKYGETGIKFEETNEHSEIIRVFVQSGNGSKITVKEVLFFRNSRINPSKELLREFQIFCIRFPIFEVEWFPQFFRSGSSYF